MFDVSWCLGSFACKSGNNSQHCTPCMISESFEPSLFSTFYRKTFYSSFAIIPKNQFPFFFSTNFVFFLNAAKHWVDYFLDTQYFRLFSFIRKTFHLEKELLEIRVSCPDLRIFLPIFPFNFENMRVVHVSDFFTFSKFWRPLENFFFPMLRLAFVYSPFFTTFQIAQCYLVAIVEIE